jgi:glycyl-tRNA synthetase beta chain
LNAAGVSVGGLTVWSTPRRLALIARDLPLATEAVSEEVKGPKTSAPEQALAGFLRKTGLTKEQLTERDGVFFAVTEKPGRATADVLAEAIPAIVRGFSWPKSQRWGAASLSTESLRWVRPLQAIVALLDGVVVDCEVGGIVAGRETMGHRFHSHGAIAVENADTYADQLRAAHVLVDHEERQGIVRTGAAKAAADAGLTLVEDEGLVVENAGLTEWPVPLLGRFDEAFLEVPPETIQLTARVNQKYFICRDADGKLADAFVCTANIAARDGGVGIVAGNRKVLAARLSDARFFWQQDRKVSLETGEKAGTHHLPREAGHSGRQGRARGQAGRMAGGGRHRAGCRPRSGGSGGGTVQGRSGHRNGGRISRIAGPDGRLLRSRRRSGRCGGRCHPRSLQAGRAGGRCAHRAGDGVCGAGG